MDLPSDSCLGVRLLSLDCFKPSCLCRAPWLVFTGASALWMNILRVPDVGEGPPPRNGGSPPRWWEATWHQTRSAEGRCPTLLHGSGLITFFWVRHLPMSSPTTCQQLQLERPTRADGMRVATSYLGVTCPVVRTYGVVPFFPSRWIWWLWPWLQWHEGDSFLGHPGQDNLSPLAHLQKYVFSAVTSSTGKLRPASVLLGGHWRPRVCDTSREHVEEGGYRLFPGCWDSC